MSSSAVTSLSHNEMKRQAVLFRFCHPYSLSSHDVHILCNRCLTYRKCIVPQQIISRNVRLCRLDLKQTKDNVSYQLPCSDGRIAKFAFSLSLSLSLKFVSSDSLSLRSIKNLGRVIHFQSITMKNHSICHSSESSRTTYGTFICTVYLLTVMASYGMFGFVSTILSFLESFCEILKQKCVNGFITNGFWPAIC